MSIDQEMKQGKFYISLTSVDHVMQSEIYFREAQWLDDAPGATTYVRYADDGSQDFVANSQIHESPGEATRRTLQIMADEVESLRDKADQIENFNKSRRGTLSVV